MPKQVLKQYKGYMPESKARELIHQVGIKTYPRPKGVPENFRVKLSNKPGGIKYVHPERDQTYVRVMPGKPHSPFPHQRQPYVTQMKNGDTLSKFGKPVEAWSPEAHIPLNEYKCIKGILE